MMHLSRSFFGLTVGLIALACSDPASPEPVTLFGCDRGIRYSLGRSVEGSIRSNDCVLEGRNADLYQLTLESAGPVTITATALDGSRLDVTLFVASGETFRESQGAPAIVGGELAAGTYVIAVTGTEFPHYPSYRLSSAATMPPVFGCSNIQPYAMRATIAGNISSQDCRAPEGFANADYYSVRLTTHTALNIYVTPPGTGSLVVGMIWDSGRLMSAEIVTDPPAPVRAALPGGLYTIFVAGIRPGHTAAYTMTSTADEAPSASGLLVD